MYGTATTLPRTSWINNKCTFSAVRQAAGRRGRTATAAVPAVVPGASGGPYRVAGVATLQESAPAVMRKG
ncbi:hypothetical protein GCM10022206_72750 [Streptomyces chiangmaiensis]